MNKLSNKWIALGVLVHGVVTSCVGAADYPRVWQQVSPATLPSQDERFTMVFDEARGVIVLVGGLGPDAFNPEAYRGTWTWNGVKWTLATTTGPGPRWGAKMVYDSQRQVCVLYGGVPLTMPEMDEAVAETWEWNGSVWHLRADTGNPPPTVGHAMAYDRIQQRAVLYGGAPCKPGACGAYPTYTWEWDGQQWRRVATSGPPRRLESAMAYDEARQRIVLFGGFNPESGTMYGDTWTWDGTTWTQLPGAGPSARCAHAMTYDGGRQAVVLFGGSDIFVGVLGVGGLRIAAAGSPENDNSVWEWDGSRWNQHPASQPPARIHHDFVHDRSRNVMILYSGFPPLGDNFHDT